MFWDNAVVSSARVKMSKNVSKMTLLGTSWTCQPLKMRPLHCLNLSETNYWWRNIVSQMNGYLKIHWFWTGQLLCVTTLLDLVTCNDRKTMRWSGQQSCFTFQRSTVLISAYRPPNSEYFWGSPWSFPANSPTTHPLKSITQSIIPIKIWLCPAYGS